MTTIRKRVVVPVNSKDREFDDGTADQNARRKVRVDLCDRQQHGWRDEHQTEKDLGRGGQLR